MKTISQEDLKKLHEVQVEILKDIDKFCREHNITYFLIAGTLLGAVRHNFLEQFVIRDLFLGMMILILECFEVIMKNLLKLIQVIKIINILCKP